jgi:hypothetical protein
VGNGSGASPRRCASASEDQSAAATETNDNVTTGTKIKRKQGATEMTKWREGNDMGGMKKKLRKTRRNRIPDDSFFLFLPLPSLLIARALHVPFCWCA